MKDRKEERQDDGAQPGQGDTVSAQGENQARKARQPHEHDESADSQVADAPSIREKGQVAHDAVAKGQQDTSRAQESDAAYQKVRKG
jgi:hypothetical protein